MYRYSIIVTTAIETFVGIVLSGREEFRLIPAILPVQSLDVKTLREPCEKLYHNGERTEGFFAVQISGRIERIYCEFRKYGGYNWLVSGGLHCFKY